MLVLKIKEIYLYLETSFYEFHLIFKTIEFNFMHMMDVSLYAREPTNGSKVKLSLCNMYAHCTYSVWYVCCDNYLTTTLAV